MLPTLTDPSSLTVVVDVAAVVVVDEIVVVAA